MSREGFEGLRQLAKDRYDEAIKISQRMNEKLINAYKKLQTAKIEARKEFAERFENKEIHT